MNKSLVTIFDIFNYGGDRIIPSEPCSPYRYLEFLIERVAYEKFKPKSLLEIGPGLDAAFTYLNLDKTDRVCALDFNKRVLAALEQQFPKVETVHVDLEKCADLEGHFEKWDMVISNSVVEHLIDDKKNAKQMYDMLKPGGILICSTVLHKRIYNFWDYAVGHYRRYSVEEFLDLFVKFSAVQLVKTSLAQELSRPLFFSRMGHQLDNTIEENNQLCGDEQAEWGRSPYAGIWWFVKYLMPLFLIVEWSKRRLFGGIGIVIAQK